MDPLHAEHPWFFGPFVIDRTRRTLSRDGELVALTPKAFDVLVVLAANGGRVVTKEAIFSAVWPDTSVDDGSLRFQVFTLRKALADGAAGEHHIVTVPGRGYQLSNTVEALILPARERPPWIEIAIVAVFVAVLATLTFLCWRRKSLPTITSTGNPLDVRNSRLDVRNSRVERCRRCERAAAAAEELLGLDV